MSTLYIRFSAPVSAAPARAALLERLLARAGRGVVAADWRAAAFGVLVPAGAALPAVGPTAAYAAGVRGAGHSAYLATPVHFVAGMTTISLPMDGVLQLAADEVLGLVGDFNRVWHGSGVRLVGTPGSHLAVVFDSALEAATHDPAKLAGTDVWQCLPAGEGGARLRRLMSEIDMWLFGHELNAARSVRGQPTITGLWLWGGGAIVEPPRILGLAAGDDPLFASLNAGEAYPDTPRGGVLVTALEPGSAHYLQWEQQWLAPALAALRAGELAQIVLSAGTRCFTVRAQWQWRFWRRPQPWWNYFELRGATHDAE